MRARQCQRWGTKDRALPTSPAHPDVLVAGAHHGGPPHPCQQHWCPPSGHCGAMQISAQQPVTRNKCEFVTLVFFPNKTIEGQKSQPLPQVGA